MILTLSISSTLIAIPAAVAALVALLVLSGFLYQWIGGLVDRKRLQVPGRLVDIGDGRRLYIVEKGPTQQGPTVVFESGFAATSLNWLHIQDAVAEHLHTVAYDRCGLGWSSAPISERTPTQVAAELRATLLAAGIQPPWILVGHSFGGLVMQRFALDYPAETAGVLLLDPMRTDEWPPVNAARLATVTRAQRLTRIGLHCSRIGITRLAVRSHLCRGAKFSGFLIRRAGSKGEYLAGRLNSEIGKMPPQVRPSIAAHWSAPRFYRGLLAHLNAVHATVLEMHSPEPIRETPVVVVTPGDSSPIGSLSKYGPRSREMFAERSRHWVHLDDPELVIRTILEMANEAGSQTPRRAVAELSTAR
jgi:pimeloyl-ACP methyl ester carboxylesterase